jgi:hypothetical protein
MYIIILVEHRLGRRTARTVCAEIKATACMKCWGREQPNGVPATYIGKEDGGEPLCGWGFFVRGDAQYLRGGLPWLNLRRQFLVDDNIAGR